MNFGNPVEATIRELAEAIVRMTGLRSTIVFRTATRRRPRAAQARHRSGARAIGMGTDHGARYGPCANDRLSLVPTGSRSQGRKFLIPHGKRTVDR